MKDKIVFFLVFMLLSTSAFGNAINLSEISKDILKSNMNDDEIRGATTLVTPPLRSGTRIITEDELLYIQKYGTGYKIKMRQQNDDGGGETELESGGSGYPSHFACGDWDRDGKDDYVTVYNQGSDQSNIFITEADGGEQFWASQPRIYHIDFGDWNGDSVKANFVTSYQNIPTDPHPIALLYQPPFADGINDDLSGVYSEYATGSSSGAGSSNSISFTASTTISYEFDIPLLFEAKVGGTVSAGIKNTYGHMIEVTKYSGKRTGMVKTPYVIAETSFYDVYVYELENGDYDSKRFTINIPDSQQTYEYGYELSEYNSICAPEFQITPQHTSGDIFSYTIDRSNGELETPITWADQMINFGGFTLSDESYTEFSDSFGIDLFAGFEIGSFEIEVTYGVETEHTHTITTAEYTDFYYELLGFPSDIVDLYKYKYKMYVRNDPTHGFPIIDFWVDPSSIQPGYYDDTPPETTITDGPSESDTITDNYCTFEWSGSDDITPNNYLEYQYKMDNEDWSSWSSYTSKSYSGLSDGSHTFRLKARDLNGNVESPATTRTFYVDTKPDPVLSYNPSNINFGTHYQGWSGSNSFDIWNSGEGTLDYSISENIDWITTGSYDGHSNGEHDTISVSVINTNSMLGSYSGDIQISSNAGSGTVHVEINIEPIPDPNLDVTPNDIDFGELKPGNSKTETITIKNIGGGTLYWEVDTSSLPSWITSVNPNSGQLEEDDTTSVQVEATAPDTPGDHYDDNFIVLNSDDSSDTETITVYLDVEGPILDVNPTTLDFTLDPNQEETQYIVIENIGSGTLGWEIDFPNQPDWVININPIDGIIEEGSTTNCYITVKAPNEPGEQYDCNFDIKNSNDPSMKENIHINLDINAPGIDVNPRTLSFNDVPPSQQDTKAITIENTGSLTLNWEIDTSNLPDWITTIVPTSGVVEPGSTEDVDVTVTAPDDPGGDYSCSFYVKNSEDPNMKIEVEINLHVSGPKIKITPTEIELELEPGEPITASIIIENDGDYGTLDWVITENINWITNINPREGTCTPRENARVDITGTAPDDTGDYSGKIYITSNDKDVTVTINLHVVGPVLKVSPTRLDFKRLEPNAQDQKPLSIENIGKGKLEWNIDTDSLPNWIISISPSEGSCESGELKVVTVKVKAPDKKGEKKDTTIYVKSNGGNVPISISLSTKAKSRIRNMFPIQFQLIKKIIEQFPILLKLITLFPPLRSLLDI